MPSNYPGALDTLTNPAAGDFQNSPSHSAQHIAANDAIEAIEAELGTDPAGAYATVAARLAALTPSAWTAFTPTWTLTTSGTTTLGNGTLTGFHKDIDAETCMFVISLVWGTTTSVSTGNAWEFALPHTAAAFLQTATGYILDAGTAYFAASSKIAASATKVTPIIAADSTPARLTNNTNPMAWAAGDEMVISGILRR